MRALDVADYVKTKVLPAAERIDRDSQELARHLREILSGVPVGRPCENGRPTLFPASDLQTIFTGSTALGFTIWQQLASTERLADDVSWREKNPEMWNEITRGELLVGSASTHLARRDRLALTGVEDGEGYVLNGSSPFVTGYGIFEKVILGFDTETSIVFAFVDFTEGQGLTVHPHDLSVIHGSATVAVEFENYRIPKSAVINQLEKTKLKIAPRKSIYHFPELGVAKAAISEIERIAKSSSTPRMAQITNQLPRLIAAVEELASYGDKDLSQVDVDDLSARKDMVIREATRLLVLASGARALLHRSLASRLHAEAMLFDVVIQSPRTLQLKAERIL